MGAAILRTQRLPGCRQLEGRSGLTKEAHWAELAREWNFPGRAPSTPPTPKGAPRERARARAGEAGAELGGRRACAVRQHWGGGVSARLSRASRSALELELRMRAGRLAPWGSCIPASLSHCCVSFLPRVK